MLKFATAEVLSAQWSDGSGVLLPANARVAHRHEFDYTPKHGMLYVRSRMISSRCNDNYDEFPADEIAQGYRTFIGKPVFVNHHNDDHRRMRGLIIDAALHRDTNPDGSPDTWVEGLMEIDGLRYPKLAQAIIAGHIERTSMGVDVKYSVCSVCNNKATTPMQYCAHVPGMKGKTHYRVTGSGSRVGTLIRETCYGLNFFENSLLVEPPADPTAYVLGKPEMGPGLDHMLPRTASLDLRNQRLRDTELLSECSVGEFQGPNLAHLSFDQLGLRVAGTDQAPASGHHVSRVVGGRPQYPVQGVLAQREVTSMSNDLPWRNGPNELGVPPSMGAHRAAPGIRQGESAVARALENSPRPRPTATRPIAGVDVGEVPLHLSHGEEPTPTAYTKTASASYPENWPMTESPVVPVDPRSLTTYTSPAYTPMNRTASLKLVQATQCLACRCHETVADRQGNAECFGCGHFWHEGHKKAALQAEAAKYDKPEDHPWFQEHPVHHSNIIDHWKEATPDEKASGMRWYPDAHLVAKGIGSLASSRPKDHPVGPTTHPLGNTHLAAGILANHSPQNGWAGNMHDAARVLHDGKGLGGKGSGMFASDKQRQNDDEMLSGKAYHEVLRGPKINDFAHLIEHGGDKDPNVPHVVVDRHALGVAAGKGLTDKQYGSAPMSGARRADGTLNRRYYDHVVNQYHQAAQHISGMENEKKPLHEHTTIAGHQVQAVTWLVRQRKNQEAERTRAAGGADSRLDRGREKSRSNAETKWNNFRQEHLPDMYQGPGTGYQASKRGGANFRVRPSGAPHVAYGETKAPADVDTLRDENCPVCGEADAWDGTACPVCSFVAPPKQFQDPNLEMAKKLDLRKQQDAYDNSIQPVNMGMDGTVGGDEQPDLVCDNCGTAFPAAEPMTTDTEDPQAGADPMESEDPETQMEGTEGGGTASEGDVCPACGKGVLVSGTELEEEGEGFPPPGDEEAEESDQDADGNGVPDDEENPEESDDEEEPGPVDPRDLADKDPDDEEPDEDDKPAKGKKNPFKK